MSIFAKLFNSCRFLKISLKKSCLPRRKNHSAFPICSDFHQDNSKYKAVYISTHGHLWSTFQERIMFCKEKSMLINQNICLTLNLTQGQMDWKYTLYIFQQIEKLFFTLFSNLSPLTGLISKFLMDIKKIDLYQFQYFLQDCYEMVEPSVKISSSCSHPFRIYGTLCIFPRSWARSPGIWSSIR